MEQPTTNSKGSLLLIGVAAVTNLINQITASSLTQWLTIMSLIILIIYHVLGVIERWEARKARKKLAKDALKRSKN